MRRRSVDAVFVTVLLAIGALPLWPIYESPALIVAGVGALVLGGAIAAVGAWRRLPAFAVAALAIAALLVFGVPLAVPTQTAGGVLPAATGLRSLVLGTATAWKQMLSVDLPLGSYEALLVPAFVVMLAAVVVGVSFALRLKRPGWGVVAPIGLFAFAIAFGARTGHRPVVAGAAFAIVALAWAVVSTAHVSTAAADRATALRLSSALALVVVCCIAGSAIAGAASPAGPRDVLRTAVQPPFDPHHYVSPLVTYRNSVLAPEKTTDMLRVSGLPSGARLRVATLDDYDGHVFAQGDSESSGSFARVASTVDQQGATGREASVTVDVEGYSGVWLPTVGALTSIAFDGADAASVRDAFFYDRETSSGAVLGGVGRGDRYSLTAVVPTATTDAQLERARPGDAIQPKATNVPKALLQAAGEHTGAATSPGEKLAAAAAWFRTGYVSSSGPGQPFSAAGHSAGRLASLATSTPMLGDAEQYAPALALIARHLGFPSRVVVGYAPTAKQEAAGSVTLTGADLTAWVEVEAANGQWLTVDSNPKVRPVPDDTTKQSQSVAQPQTVLPPPPPVQHDTAVTQNRDSQKAKHEPGLPAWLAILLASLRVVGIVLLIVAIVLAPLWSIALARWLRRRRRRRADREAGVVTGAWNEILDAAIDRGYTVPRAATRYEVAALVGSDEVRGLAERAERSVFSSQTLEARDIDDFWVSTRGASRGLGAGESRWARLRYHLNARSLVGRLPWRRP